MRQVEIALTFLAGVVLASVISLSSSARDGNADATHAHPDGSGFLVTSLDHANPESDGGPQTAADVGGHWISQHLCAFGGSATCVDVLRCQDGTPMLEWILVADDGREIERYRYCPESGLTAQPQVSPGMVLRALRRIDLPASELTVQPPGGQTLVNFATNFYTEQDEFTRTVRILGQRVDLRIWPSEFGWRFGDGHSLASTQPGAPYPDLQITHEYLSKGGVSPRVDTTYAAEFRVNDGPWRDVNGTVTIPGDPVQLRVRTATPVLVGSADRTQQLSRLRISERSRA